MGGPNLEKVGPRRCGPEGCGPEGWGPEGWGPEGWGPNGGGPKFRAFFSLSRHSFFFSFFPLFWSFSWNFGGVLKRRCPEMCTFGVLWLSCASPGGPVWWGRRGFTRQPKSPNVHISGSPASSKTPPKFHEEDQPEREKRKKTVAGEGKKRERNFGRSGGGRSGAGRSGGGGVRRRGVRRRGPEHTHHTRNTTTTTQQQHNTTTTQHNNNTAHNNTETHNTQHTTHNTHTHTTNKQKQTIENTPTPKPTTTTTTPEHFAKTLKHPNWPKSVWPKSVKTLKH